MSSPPLPAAGKPADAGPNLLLWLAVHLAVIAAAAVLFAVYEREVLGWVAGLGPFGLGLAQAVALRRRLPVWAVVLWPLATALGSILSFVFVLFMYFMLGLCFGLCQAGLLAAGRLRGWWLWPVISGLSWVTALCLGGMITRPAEATGPVSGTASGLMYASVLLVYALSTGLGLRWMGRRSASAA